MQPWLVLLLSIITLVLSTYLFHKSAFTLDLTKLNIVSVIFYCLLFLSFIGSVLIGMGIDQHYMGKHLKHEDTRIIGWAIVQLVMVLFPLIMLVIGKALRFEKKEYEEYLEIKTQVINSDTDRGVFLVMCILSFICIVSIGYTFFAIGLDNNPILNMIAGESSEKLARLRIMANREFPGNRYVRNILALGLTPFLSYIAFIYLKLTKSKNWIALFSILFICSLIITFYDLQKAPILRYLLTFIIVNIYFGDKLKLKQILCYGALAAFMIVLLYVFVSGDSLQSIFSVTSGPLNRLFISQCMPLFLHVEVFTYRLPFLQGASFPAVISENILGRVHERTGRIVMEAVNPEGVSKGVAGVANGLFVSEAYGNFGWIGIIMGILYVAALVYLIYVFFVRINKNPLSVALFAYVTSLYANTMHGGFIDFIYNPMLIILIVTCIGIVKSSELCERIWSRYD